MSKQDGLVQELIQQDFEKVIQDNEIVVIDFWAKWCAPCLQFAKTYAKVANIETDVLFTKVNIEQQAELAEIFQVRSIPHLVIFKREIAIYSEAGSMPESTLKELIQQARDVDVSDIQTK
tara:strand:- start:14 stop:373 length:360 start_codon:yes stop_codon:yes gene_type:complete